MQPDSTPPNSGRVAFRSGLIIGLILAVVEAVILVISTFYSIQTLESAGTTGSVANVGSSLIIIALSILGFLLGLAAYFVAGILGSRVTGKVNTGVFAGMWAGVFYGVIDCIVYIVLFFTMRLAPTLDYYNRLYHSALQVEQARTIAIATAVIWSIVGIGLAVGWGAGLGALGGLLGRRSSKAPHPQQPYPVQFYSGQPYPGQPYPGQPYPPQNYPGQPYPPQNYPGQPWPYAQPQAQQQGSGNAVRSEQSGSPSQDVGTRNGANAEGPQGVGEARNVERTQIDRSPRPPQQASQAWPPATPWPEPASPEQPDVQRREPENPYSN